MKIKKGTEFLPQNLFIFAIQCHRPLIFQTRKLKIKNLHHQIAKMQAEFSAYEFLAKAQFLYVKKEVRTVKENIQSAERKIYSLQKGKMGNIR